MLLPIPYFLEFVNKMGCVPILKQKYLFLILLYTAFSFLSCGPEKEIIQFEKPPGRIDLEFIKNRIELRNPLPRNGEEVEVIVVLKNRGTQPARRIPVYFYDNLRVFETEEINLEPNEQIRLSTRWKATTGSHTISVIIDPAHHFREINRERSEVSTTVLVR